MTTVTEIEEIYADVNYPYVLNEIEDLDTYTGVTLRVGKAYTEFWGGRPGYAVLDDVLSYEETATIARLAGFNHFRHGVARREVRPRVRRYKR